MRTLPILVTLLAGVTLSAHAGKKATPTPAPAATKPASESPQFETHTLVLLQRGERAAEFSEAELAELQKQHLAHLTKLGNEGKIVVAGPFADQADESLRGACIYALPIAEAAKLAEADPMVKAGRLKVVAMTWWTEKGYMTFPKAPAKVEN